MATYYNFLPSVRLDRAVVSVPYVDAFGTGMYEVKVVFN